MRLAALTLALLLAACSPKPAAPVAAPPSTLAAVKAPEAPAAVADYLAALAAVEQAKAPVSLEPLLEKADTAQSALMEVSGEQAVLERYSDAEFASLQTQVRGLKLHRELDIYAQPDPAFFWSLAKAHGQAQDLAFFEQYNASWGADLVPTYLKLRPQPSPCVRFGEDRIAPLYTAWKNYAAQYPGAYRAKVQQNLADLEEAVALGTCACDGLASVQREQTAFLKLFPDNPKAGEIKARAEQLLKDPEAMPVNCR